MSNNDNALAKPFDMNATLDDIDDLPAFSTFPSGAYSIRLLEGLVEKKIGEHPAIEMEMTLVETLEMTEPLKDGEVPPKPNDTCSTAFMLDNKFGVGALKEVLKVIAPVAGSTQISACVAASKGMAFMVVLKRSYDSGTDRHYANIKKIVPL